MPELSPRAEQLLKTLVAKYIGEGLPIGSKSLSVDSGLDVSPATIRNILSELESLGFVMSPHTSAGRVPTVQGYRMFVDSMMHIEPIKKNIAQEIESNIAQEIDPELLVNKASNLVSQLTQYAGVVMVSEQYQRTLKQIEFLSLSAQRILAILVTDDGRVQNKVIQVEKGYSASELVEASNYFNSLYAGKSLTEVKKCLFQDIQVQGDHLGKMIQTSMNIAQSLFDSEKGDDVILSGETNLLNVPEFGQLDKVKDIFQVFKTKNDLLDLLDKSMRADGIQVYIGEESGYQLLNGFSVVSKPYKVDGECVGVLGVIGPTRMEYSKVIPVVDLTSKLLANALSKNID